MKAGESGRITIPKEIRERFAIRPGSEVEFEIAGSSIVLKKVPQKLNLARWKGKCGKCFASLGYSSVDQFIDDVRGS